MTVRVVVTGASGSVGTALLRTVPTGQVSVHGISRRPPAADQPPYDRAGWTACDVGGTSAVPTLSRVFAGANAVVHLAWAIQPRTGDPPGPRTNVTGTRQVLDAVVRAGVRHLVFVSSVAAYTAEPRWMHVDESWPRGGIPGNAYSRDKAAVEDLIDAFEREAAGVRVARIRPCAIVQHDAGGEIGRWTMSPLLPRLMLGSRWLPMPVWPHLRAQIVHAEDVARALWAIVTTGAVGSYNLAGTPVLTGSEMGRVMGRFGLPLPRGLLSGLAWPTWRVGLQPVHPGWLTMADQAALVDTDRARRELDWQPRHDARAALAGFVEGVRVGAGTASPALAPQPRLRFADRLASIGWGRPSHQRA
jgi:UDP-glucose 4-epimerase